MAYGRCLTLLLVLFATVTCSALKAESVAFAKTFVKGAVTGTSAVQRAFFTIAEEQPASLKITNGTPDSMTLRVISAKIRLNGVSLINTNTTQSFSRDVGELSVLVPLAAGQNRLEVELLGRTGTRITVEVITSYHIADVSVDPPAGEVSSVISTSGVDESGTDGTFNVLVPDDKPTLGVASDSSGNPMLMGWLDAGTSNLTIDARSTAEVLLFYALGAYTLPRQAPEIIVSSTLLAEQDYDYVQVARNLIKQDARTTILADRLTQILSTDAQGLSDGNPLVLSAVQTAVQDILAPQPASTRSAGLLSAITEPSFPQSGLVLLNVPDMVNTFRFVNQFRRNGWMFVEKTKDYFGSEGGATTETPYNPPMAVKDAYVEATNGLSGTFGSLTDAFTGNSAYAEKSQDSFNLPTVDDTDDSPVRSDYRAIVVGPGLQAGGDGILVGLTDAQMQKYNEVCMEWFFCELFIPAITNSFPMPVDMTDFSPKDLVGGLSEALINKVPGFQRNISEGKYKDALSTALAIIADDEDLQLQIAQQFVTAIGLNSSTKYLGPIQKHLGKVLSAVRIVDCLFAAGDIGAVLGHAASSNRADMWTITMIPFKVIISPEEIELHPGGQTNVSVTVKDGAQTVTEGLRYVWSCAQSAVTAKGYLVDPATGVTFVTPLAIESRTVRYMAPTSSTGLVTVTCKVEQQDESDDSWKEIKTVQCKITITPQVGNGTFRVFTSTNEDGTRYSCSAAVVFDLVDGEPTGYHVHGTGISDPWYYGDEADIYAEGDGLPSGNAESKAEWRARVGEGKGVAFLSGAGGPIAHMQGTVDWMNQRFANGTWVVTPSYPQFSQ